MAKREEIGFREELLKHLHAEPYAEIRITVAGGKEYQILDPRELMVGESVASLERRDGSRSFFRLQQISNVDVSAEV